MLSWALLQKHNVTYSYNITHRALRQFKFIVYLVQIFANKTILLLHIIHYYNTILIKHYNLKLNGGFF